MRSCACRVADLLAHLRADDDVRRAALRILLLTPATTAGPHAATVVNCLADSAADVRDAACELLVRVTPSAPIADPSSGRLRPATCEVLRELDVLTLHAHLPAVLGHTLHANPDVRSGATSVLRGLVDDLGALEPLMPALLGALSLDDSHDVRAAVIEVVALLPAESLATRHAAPLLETLRINAQHWVALLNDERRSGAVAESAARVLIALDAKELARCLPQGELDRIDALVA